jgi:hypothetical protein
MSYSSTGSYLSSGGGTSFLYIGTSSELQTIVSTFSNVNWYANDADTGIITNILVTGASINVNGDTVITGDSDFIDGDSYYFTPGKVFTCIVSAYDPTSTSGNTGTFSGIDQSTVHGYLAGNPPSYAMFAQGIDYTNNNPDIVNAEIYQVNYDITPAMVYLFDNTTNPDYNQQFTSGNKYYFTNLPIPIVPTSFNGGIATFDPDYKGMLYLVNSPSISGQNTAWFGHGDILEDDGLTNVIDPSIITTNPYTITIGQNFSGGAIYFSHHSDFVCFKEDSKILCLINDVEKYVPVQDIKIGYLVKTHLHGYKKVTIIGEGKMHNNGNNNRIKDRLYKYTKEKYLDLTEDLVITGGHSILVDELTEEQKEKTKDYWNIFHKTDDKYRLLAVVDEKSIPYEEVGTFNIYHFVLEADNENTNFGVYANGLLVESCIGKSLKNIKQMKLTE